MIYQIEYDRHDLKGAIRCGFMYLETKDEIVGTVYARPETVKAITLSMPDDVIFSFIPEGVGMLRTAYLKFLPTAKDNEIRFLNQDNNLELRMLLI